MDRLPLLDHHLGEPSTFTPEDWLVNSGLAQPFPSWGCFHTTMFAMEVAGRICGIVPRTIGGPFAVLIAEQLAASGAQLIVGLTSAGRVARDLPLPCRVVITTAVRDEGTSLHYLPASKEVACPSPELIAPLAEELAESDWSVRRGKVWTTDAPYRETQSQLDQWFEDGVLAVEMQAASLFAFGAARGVAVASIAMVSNAVDHEGEQFNTGSQEDGLRII
jgi:uridine phosphorylase